MITYFHYFIAQEPEMSLFDGFFPQQLVCIHSKALGPVDAHRDPVQQHRCSKTSINTKCLCQQLALTENLSLSLPLVDLIDVTGW